MLQTPFCYHAYYVENVDEEIKKLVADLNSFEGFSTSSKMLKGDIAEFWHADTFNIKAALEGSKDRAWVDRSHDFASTDVSTMGIDILRPFYKSFYPVQ